MVTGIIIQLHVCRSAGVAFRKELLELRRSLFGDNRFRCSRGLPFCLRSNCLNSFEWIKTHICFLYFSDIEGCSQNIILMVEITIVCLMELEELLFFSQTKKCLFSKIFCLYAGTICVLLRWWQKLWWWCQSSFIHYTFNNNFYV